MHPNFAIIGGTGLYRFCDLQLTEKHVVETPFGDPSGPITTGSFQGKQIAFLARHGENHRLAPHRINYRANIWALHALGVRRIVSVNAVGGIRTDMAPQAVVIPDQIIDYTYGRANSYCDRDAAEVLHIDFSEPYSAKLRYALIAAARKASVAVIDGGVYGATQGPRLETVAEIERMRRDGCDLVGMTGMPEAALSRELECEYASISLIANWAAGCGDKVAISLDEIYANLDTATRSVPPIIAALELAAFG